MRYVKDCGVTHYVLYFSFADDCDKDGIYSGYANQPGGINTIGQTFCRGIQLTDSNGQVKFTTIRMSFATRQMASRQKRYHHFDTVGQTFLRGVQMTDANGQCSFISIYPGWYPSRVNHVHFKVRLTATTYVTSQFAFQDSINTAVYQTPLYVAKGQNSLTNATDSIFQSANPTGLVIAVTSNAATGGYDGAYTIVTNATTGVKDSEITPEEFSLHQNYPNPFNPTTTIAYNLSANSEVTLTNYDVYGQEVATLVQAKRSAGTHEVTFDASQLSSGFYLYQLRAGSFVATKEMLLIK